MITVLEKVKENEAIKLIRVKDSMKKLGKAYVNLGQKCSIIFNAHNRINDLIPDVCDKEIHEISYKGKRHMRYI